MEQGYIKLYRYITKKSWYRKQKFTWAQAWIDMLLMARWQNDVLIVDYKNYEVPVGSFVTSQRKLATRWRWSISTVNAFFNFLQKSEHQIEYKTEHSFTHIYILNWEKYQGKTEQQTEQQTEHSPNTPRTLPEHSPKQIKKLKKLKNDKNVKEKNKKELPVLPSVLQNQKGFPEIWQDWIAHRAEKKRPLKSTAAKIQIKFLSKQPNPLACVEKAIRCGWQGLFALKESELPDLPYEPPKMSESERKDREAFEKLPIAEQERRKNEAPAIMEAIIKKGMGGKI